MMLEEVLPPVEEAMVTDWLCQREERESSSPTSNACNALLQSTNLQFPCRYLYSTSLLCVLFSNHALQCSVLNISNTVCFILQCSAVKAPIAPLGRAPVENGDTEDTSPSLTMLLPLICCVIGPMLCKSHWGYVPTLGIN